MRPDERNLDEEIRSHLALDVRERIPRGEDPEVARLTALRESGYVPALRDSMRRVGYSRRLDAVAALGQDMRVGLHSHLRAKGLAATVAVTPPALGVGANAAIFSVVGGVLLRPLVNRGEHRLVYIRQSAQGLGAANTTFSVPKIGDFKSRVTTIGAFGDLSTIELTMIGVGGRADRCDWDRRGRRGRLRIRGRRLQLSRKRPLPGVLPIDFVQAGSLRVD